MKKPLIKALTLAFCFFWGVSAQAASTVKITRNKKNYTYSKRKDTIKIKGKNVSLAKTPIFLKEGAYVGPVKEIFISKLGVKSSSLSNQKTLTLSYRKNTLKIKENSKTATLNGKTCSLAAKPIHATYASSKKTGWIVPIYSICARLGMNYKIVNNVINITEKAQTSTPPSTSATTATQTPTVAAKETKPIVLVLDAGHGGSDSGATAKWDIPNSIEKNMTLRIVKEAKKYFDKDKKYTVYYTRLYDTYPSLDARYKLANDKKADIFISVHINSYGPASTGTETLYSADRNSKTKKNGINSKDLAQIIHAHTVKATGFYNRGLVNRPNLKVLKYTNMPACLIEYGFITNKKEYNSMNKNYANYGKALYEGVLEISKKMKR